MGAATFKFPTVSNPRKKFSVTVAKIVPVQAVKAYGVGAVAPLILNIATGWRVTCVCVCVCMVYMYLCMHKIYIYIYICTNLMLFVEFLSYILRAF